MISQDNINLRCLNVDSRERLSGSSEDFTFYLQEPMEKPRNCVGWVATASLPTTWPNVSGLNNILYLIERAEQPGAGTNTLGLKLAIEEGQFQASDLATKIGAAIANKTRPPSIHQ